MSLSNSMLITIEEIRCSLDKDKPILENIKAAMKQAKNHWLVVNEEERFRSAIGAVLLIANEDDKQILTDEMKGIQIISTLQSGIPVDIEAAVSGLDMSKFFGLLKIWKEIS